MKKITILLGFLGFIVSLEARKLTHSQALAMIKEAGIKTNNPNCYDRNNKSCTSLDQIRAGTIYQIIAFKRLSGCPIVITGGTETGHSSRSKYSHWNGYKVDIRKTSCVTNFITNNNKIFTRQEKDRSDGAKVYKTAVGNIYALEDKLPHWDITYI